MSRRIATVTGGNKGIGFAICKLLYQQPHHPLHVILTSRDAERGLSAVSSLKQQIPQSNNTIEFHQLDIENSQSISDFANWIKDSFGKFDILINNAGIAYKGPDWNYEVARHTNSINYFGTKKALDELLPLINDGGRIVNVSSRAGNISKFSNEWQSKLQSPSLTEKELSDMVTLFIDSVRDDTYEEKGFPKTTYGVSKVALTTLTQVLARDPQYINRNILINSCCPGWVRTDMGGERAHLSPDEGADTPVWLSLLPEDSNLTGAFCAERKVLIPLPI